MRGSTAAVPICIVPRSPHLSNAERSFMSIRRTLPVCALFLVATTGAVTPPRITALRIEPGSARLCPGKTLGATYVATMEDGTTQRIAPDALDRTGDGATATRD